MKWVLLILFFVGCNNTERQDLNGKQVAEILAGDRINKELELVYLKEIQIAQDNMDNESLEFYLEAYMQVPRLTIPKELKSDPRYFTGGDKIKY